MVYATFFLKNGKLKKEIIIFERTSKGVATCINWEKKRGGGGGGGRKVRSEYRILHIKLFEQIKKPK